MVGFLRNLNPVSGLGRHVRSQLRLFGSATPFDLELDAQNDKYSELNNMYTTMFTGKDSEATTPSSSGLKTNSSSLESEIDEINAELLDSYSFSPKVLSGKELAEIVKTSGRFMIQSLSRNPYYNLAVEDYVFKNTPVEKGGPFFDERLLFYVNDKCAVIGKNQTPWKELFLQNCKSRGYQYVRRLSGGGAVVHDLGNVNYSYLTSRDAFRREYFNEQIVAWLKEAQPKANISLNERGDIQLDDYKISGSAFKIAGGKSYHHGTMLVNADLASFRGLLKPAHIDGITWSGGSVDSVRSHVKNIQDAGIKSTTDFIDICTKGFRSIFQENVPIYLVDEVETQTEEIMKTAEQLASDEWLYDNGPKFTVTVNDSKFSVEKGLIVDCPSPHMKGERFKNFVDSFNRQESETPKITI
ncbi:LAFA_0C01530g1_1 [Lachancea sp. 'fantastica']|nr:LAFA_0C01530g1_1 [Lachancea sp. 'fantastica']